MRRILTSMALSVALLISAGFLTAGGKKRGPMTGTWECTAHGSPQGDIPFTLYLEQDKEVVTGSVSSPLGSTELTSASFKSKTLEIRIDTPQGNYVIMGKLKKGALTGTWSRDDAEKGTWEGKKAVAQNP